MLVSMCSLSIHASTLLILGDSLSAGYMMATEQSWPVLLQKQWKEQSSPSPSLTVASAAAPHRMV